MRAAAVALLLLLAACGGGSEEPADPVTSSASSTPTPVATTRPVTAPPDGRPAPEALMRFRCDQKGTGSWRASGFLVNGGKAAVTFQVTVQIGEVTGGSTQAKTKQVPNVAAGGSVAFEINKVPAPEDGGTCHVQVLSSAP